MRQHGDAGWCEWWKMQIYSCGMCSNLDKPEEMQGAEGNGDAEWGESCAISSVCSKTWSCNNSRFPGHCSKLKTESCGSFLAKSITEFPRFQHHLEPVRFSVQCPVACCWVRSAQGPLSLAASTGRFTLNLDSLPACTLHSKTILCLKGIVKSHRQVFQPATQTENTFHRLN